MKKFMFILLSVLLVFAVCSCATTAEKVNYPLTYVLTEDTYASLVDALFTKLELPEETLAEYGGAEVVKKDLKDQLIAQIPMDSFKIVLVNESSISVQVLGNEEQKATYKLEEGVLSVDWEAKGTFEQLGLVQPDYSVLNVTTTSYGGFLPLYLEK